MYTRKEKPGVTAPGMFVIITEAINTENLKSRYWNCFSTGSYVIIGYRLSLKIRWLDMLTKKQFQNKI